MAVKNQDIHIANLRRFVPTDAIFPSSTLSTETRPLSQTTPVPTRILTDPNSQDEDPNAGASRLALTQSSSRGTSSHASVISSVTSVSTSTSSAVAGTGHGVSTSTLIISIVIPLVLIAILIPLIILLCLTCRRKRQRQNRSSNHSQAKMRPPERQKELLAHRPRGKYGPSIIMRRPNSFSGFDFNFSRPRTVLSRISARSPKATTPMNASRSTTLGSLRGHYEELPPMPRRPALNLVSRYASQDKHVPTGLWDSPCSTPAPPPYARTRPVTLPHPHIPPSLSTPQPPDTPRSTSPQLQVATPIEIQRLSGPYAPISQVLRQPEQPQRLHPRSQLQRHPRSPLGGHSEVVPMSANLSAPFQPSTSPALSDVSGLSFDPSMWIAAYERDSVVNPVHQDDDRRMDPHQLV